MISKFFFVAEQKCCSTKISFPVFLHVYLVLCGRPSSSMNKSMLKCSNPVSPGPLDRKRSTHTGLHLFGCADILWRVGSFANSAGFQSPSIFWLSRYALCFLTSPIKSCTILTWSGIVKSNVESIAKFSARSFSNSSSMRYTLPFFVSVFWINNSSYTTEIG